MPLMSGEELLLQIRDTHNDQLTPFLMLTARADVDSVKSVISSSVTEYIAKPFDKSILLEKVFSLLSGREAEKEIDNIPVENCLEIQEKIIEIIRIRLQKDYINPPFFLKSLLKPLKLLMVVMFQ